VPALPGPDPDAQLLEGSALFDTAPPPRTYPDVAASDMGAVEHYLRHGAAEGRDPGPGFSTAGYLRRYPDVADAGLNPLLHYLRHGQAEGRSPR
jgi:hypothetical protein